MQLINNLKLKNKLILMLIVPIIGMVLFSFSVYHTASSEAENAKKMLMLTDVAIEVNRSIVTLQDELDYSIKFIKSHGRKFNAELDRSQQQTDVKMTLLNKAIGTLQSVKFNDTFETRLENVKKDISGLAETRQAIKNKKLKTRKSRLYYQQFIENMMLLIEMMPRITGNKELANSSSAYVNFLRLKNLAGEEKEILFNVFKRDQFLGKEFNEFNQSVNFQTVYQDSFLSLANEDEKSYFNSLISDEVVGKAQVMRDKAFVAADYGAFNIDPAEWLKIQQSKINLLNKVAEKLTEDVKNKAEMTQASSSQLQLKITLFSIFVYLLTAFFWYLMSREISTSVNRISHILDRIAIGDLTTSIQGVSKDEFGHLLESIDETQRNLKSKIDQEAVIAAANARVKEALDNVSANVMVADQNNDIIYMNEAALNLFTHIEDDLAKVINGFRASEIVGSNIDRFHKNPLHQQNLLKSLNNKHETRFLAGTRSMSFIANPVLGENGDRLGTVVEWKDQTNEINTEQEIESIVNAVKQGDLNQRITTEGKSGFFLNLSQGFNEVVAEVSDSLDDIDHSMLALSTGDLTRTIDRKYLGKFDSVASHVNETIDKLGHIVGEIYLASQEVTNTAKEILDGNNRLSSRTEHQAAALEKTASSMEEITSTVIQNSDNAQMGNDLSTDAREMANTGGDVVDEAVNAMQEINDSSKKIAEIIGVIDEIAFQTNLLALNASVEAARAGEQGRGFAVVATEVRNLAGRSATAAKEIKDLIQDSVRKINAGSELVNKSGDTLKDIVLGVKKVGDIVGEIASASHEQSTGIEQVNAAVTSMDETTQQNAALAEQISSASVTLSELTSKMIEQLQFFKQDQHLLKDSKSSSGNQASQVKKTTIQRFTTGMSAASKAFKKPVEPVNLTVDVNQLSDDEWEEF